MNFKHFLLTGLLLPQFLFAQIIPADRRTDWGLSGYRDTIPTYTNEVDITTFGGVGDGTTSNNLALQNAIASLNGASGTIYFPSGNFLFTASITLRDSIVLKGSSSDSTTLSFNLGGNGDLIRMAGTVSSTTAIITSDAYKDSTFILVDNPSLFTSGDYIKVTQNDSTLVLSSWAYGTVGQICEVKDIVGNRVNLNSSLRKNYLVAENCKTRKITPRKNTGIECLKVKRLDSSVGQTTNIDFNYAVKCWVKGVEGDMCNFGHIVISNSSNIEVSGCFLHDAFAYGSGGQGYGVVIQYTSGECLVENNIFNHLRHSMLLQAGANGNVFGYNSSTNPYWVSGFLPSNSAGDMVLHGNYVFMNLFEGNQGQNIVIDDSHGRNGPYNTFFRNRADLYGIFMNSNPPSNNQNIVGNEVTSTASLQGLYTLSGTAHLAHGNNVKGTIMPNGTTVLADTSYYRKSMPGFFNSYSTYPNIGIPNTISSGTIPARQRYNQSSDLTDCRVNYPYVYPNRYTSVNDTFCNGSTYNFNGTIINSGGAYSDTINTGKGYDSVITLHLTKTDIDSSVIINSNTLTAFETNAVYQWIDCITDSSISGATAQSHVASQTGSFKVRISKNNCEQESNCMNVVVSGIKRMEEFSFSVQPNPVKDFCLLNLSKPLKLSGAVYNVIGEKVFQFTSEEMTAEYTFNTQLLKSGFYFIRIMDNKGRTETQRIIVDR
ncbi:MAG: glycosyl hydrolase family 28-related protein [Bacteroidota bacterium]